MTSPAVSVVIPVYRNAETLRELHLRLTQALAGHAHELVFVDDGCDAGSGAVLRELATADMSVDIVELATNRGQHAAVLAGLERARGEWMVVLDADLQDPPEAIPQLLAARDLGAEAVFAGRRGDYESRFRLLTGRGYRRLLGMLTGVPADAGIFVALSRRMRDRLLELQAAAPSRRPSIVAMIGRAGLPVTSVPVERASRSVGRSEYSGAKRLRVALDALAWAGVGRLNRRAPRATQVDLARHNAGQRRYFESDIKATMVPRDTPYLNRHVDEILRAAEIGPGDRVLEVGCGMGRYTLLLADRGVRVEGFDLTPFLLERLAEYAGDRYEIPLHQGDAADPPLELHGQFDAVIGLFALHHMEEIPTILRSLALLLRPGGRIAFCEPNPLNPLYYVQIAARPGMTWEGDGGIVRMRRAPVERSLREAGFTDLYWRRFGFFPPSVANSELRRLERPLETFPLWRPALPFQLFGGRLPD